MLQEYSPSHQTLDRRSFRAEFFPICESPLLSKDWIIVHQKVTVYNQKSHFSLIGFGALQIQNFHKVFQYILNSGTLIWNYFCSNAKKYN